MCGRDLKNMFKVSEVAVEAARKRKAGRAGPVDLDMNLSLQSFLPADTTQYYYYQVSIYRQLLLITRLHPDLLQYLYCICRVA